MPEQKHSSQEKNVSCIPKTPIPSFANTTGAHRLLAELLLQILQGRETLIVAASTV